MGLTHSGVCCHDWYLSEQISPCLQERQNGLQRSPLFQQACELVFFSVFHALLLSTSFLINSFSYRCDYTQH